MGFMLIKSKNHDFNYDDLTLFDNLSIQIGSALERIKIHNKFIKSEQERIAGEERAKILKSLAGSIAHEMRNPLGAINMAISNSNSFFTNNNRKLILEGDDLKSVIENYEISLNSINRANKIIDITLNELKGEKPDPKNFSYYNIYDSIKQAVREYGYNDKEEKLRIKNKITKQDNFIFKGDETLFIYIIFNLLKNALYYPNSIITISKQENKTHNIIQIHDTGPGIKPEIIKNIFDDFTTSGKTGGTGLGLAFCKRTMQAFGGDIECESEFGKYTNFLIHFPKISEANLEKAEKIIAKRNNLQNSDDNKFSEIELTKILKNKNIILADDEEVNRKIIKKSLIKYGANIVEVKSGKEAFELIVDNYNKFDLILTDIMMPIMSGIELIKNIRKFELIHNKLTKIPVIAITGDSDKEAILKTFNDELCEYFVKGSDNKQLINIIINLTDKMPCNLTTHVFKA